MWFRKTKIKQDHRGVDITRTDADSRIRFHQSAATRLEFRIVTKVNFARCRGRVNNDVFAVGRTSELGQERRFRIFAVSPFIA